MPKLVIIESPYAGGKKGKGFARFVDAITFGPFRRRLRNVRYARAAVRDSIVRFGEAPIASHLLYTQPGILRDDVPAERTEGIEAGLAWGRVADLSAIYVDLDVSPGMRQGVRDADAARRPWRFRRVPGWRAPWYCRR